ncbi:MAG: galactokinase [Bacteroidia bacterium]|nr:galactokinase [Bacteroidia bacterium]NNF30983.1 galactokinase [Flavobacteriaceae bacterium]MBT8274945.1 galactokinase [Bacteroidia bacterium]NNJ82628.1 galactokinase [Flavobacteriaceae bacterium]NNK53130.1 galactokinase [Flavobacteriaceae bacterium]
MTPFISKAPGRICLFGDHQDYLGLPVIACAINRYIQIKGSSNNTNLFKISMPDLKLEFVLPLDKNDKPLKKGDHLEAVMKVVNRYGCIPDQGYDIEILGDLPINAGLSSSSAMVVAWVQWLLAKFGSYHELSPTLIAKLAYEAEVLEQNSPGGKMDQYTSAIGGIIYLETDEESNFRKLESELDSLIIGESGIPKDTVGMLDDLKNKALTAISLIKSHNPKFDIHEADLTDYENYKEILPEPMRPYLFAAIMNHLITKQALAEFQQKNPDNRKLGELINAHHEILRDILQITVPKIDAMVHAAIRAGAYGAKIVGSGGGGSIVAIAPEDKEDWIVSAMKEAGAIAAYPVNVANGAHIIK